MSIIVTGVDLPERCEFCPMCRFYRNTPNVWCNAKNKRVMTDWYGDQDVEIEVPDWCPIRDVPEGWKADKT